MRRSGSATLWTIAVIVLLIAGGLAVWRFGLMEGVRGGSSGHRADNWTIDDLLNHLDSRGANVSTHQRSKNAVAFQSRHLGGMVTATRHESHAEAKKAAETGEKEAREGMAFMAWGRFTFFILAAMPDDRRILTRLLN